MHVYYQTAHMYTQMILSNLRMYTSRIVSFILTQDDINIHVFYTLFQHSLCMDSDKLDLYAASELHVQLVTSTSKKTSKNAS